MVMGFEWPLETEPAEALPINANDWRQLELPVNDN
jgi:hypothetical protein